VLTGTAVRPTFESSDSTPPPMSYFCPTCDRILYNRRLANCGFCNAPIPEELRFTAAEIAALDRRTAEIEKASREREQAREAEEVQKRQDYYAGTQPSFWNL
jgi:hypothetical protein